MDALGMTGSWAPAQTGPAARPRATGNTERKRRILVLLHQKNGPTPDALHSFARSANQTMQLLQPKATHVL
jgi:hypothetical protein